MRGVDFRSEWGLPGTVVPDENQPTVEIGRMRAMETHRWHEVREDLAVTKEMGGEPKSTGPMASTKTGGADCLRSEKYRRR